MLGLVLYSCLVFGFIGISVCGVRTIIKTRTPDPVDFYSANLFCLSFLHALILIGIPLSIISKCLLGTGLVFLGMTGLKLIKNPNFNINTIVTSWYFWIVSLTMIFFFKCLLEGIGRWDPRSIYFFHGKIIYFAGKFSIEPWKLREIQFSHQDYPKLTACLAALIATSIGYWNEYWPQMACGSLMLILQQGVFSLPLKLNQKIMIHLVLFSVPGYFLWVGDQDGYLAGFLFLSLIYLGIGMRYQDNLLIRCGLLNLITAMQLKNEGLIAALIVLGISLIINPTKLIRAGFSTITTGSLSPVFIWSLYRLNFGIRNDLTIGFKSEAVLSRIVSWNLFWKDFLHYYFLKTSMMWTMLVGFISFWGLKRCKLWKWDISVTMAFLCCVIYSIVLTFVYLSTHWEVLEHLKTSVSRVAFTPALMLLGGVLLASPLTRLSKEFQSD